MARLSKTGGNASPAKGRKTTKTAKAKTKRRIVLKSGPRKSCSISDLKAQLDLRTKQLDEALAQQTATAEILKVINSSPNDLTPVFDIILEKAHSLCDVSTGGLELYEGDIARSVATRGMNERWQQYLRQGYRITEVLRPAYQTLRPGHVVDMRTLVERFPDEPAYRGFVEIGGLRTFLALPLVKDGIVFGRIVAARAEVRPFTDGQIRLLQSFADQAVIAIENARLLTEQREALERQTATADILKVISSSVADTTPVFEQILDSCERLAAFNRMAIFLLGEDGQVRIGAYRGGEGDALKAAFPQPLANTPMSLAFARQQVLLFGDVLNNPDAPASLRIAASTVGSFSVLVAPLLWEGRGIGAFHVARDADATFSDREVALFKTFADQAAIAIQNARLFKETREALEQQKASADILSVISSSVADAQPVFDKILVSCKHLFGGDELDVLLVDEQGQLNIAAYIGDFHDVVAATFPAPVECTAAGRAIRERRVMHWPDLVNGEDVPGVLRKMGKLIGYRSMVFAPMLWEGRGIGAIGVARSTGPFKPKELAMLQTFADQAVIAIQNARLFDEVQAKTNYLSESLQQQTAVGEVLKTISRSTFDLQPVLDALVETAARLCDTEMAFIMRREGEVYRAGAAIGYSEDYIEFLKNHPLTVDRGTITGRAVLERRTVQILDTATDPEYRLRESTSLAGQHTALCVPLMRENEPIGTIVLARQRVEAFTPKQIELVTTFADQAVIAIENVRLFDEVRQRTDDLSESLQQQTATADVLKVISRSAFDLSGVLDTLVSSAARLCGDPRASIYLLRDGLLHLEAACNISADWIEYRRNHPMAPSPDTPSGRAALTGRVDHVPDLLEDPNFTRSDLVKLGDYRATLNVPLSRDGETVGVLSLARPEPGPFTQRQIDLVQTFADQAVIAIENVRLFDEVQAKTRDLTEALTYQTGSGNILKVIASSPTDVGPVLAAIAENAAELCDAYDAAVLLKVGDDLHFSAHHGSIPIGLERWPINRNWTAGRAYLDQKPVHIHDLRADENADFSDGRELSLRMGHRSILSVPLLRENESIGAIVLRRKEVHPFSDKQIALLQTFADQAVIAISNVRLFEQVQERTRELSQSLDDLRAAQDRLVQTEKLASLGQLTAGIAHEIKNPLNFVNNFSALSAELVDELNDTLKPAVLESKMRLEVDDLTEMLKGNLEKVVQHGKRADSIVKNMLLHSREGSGEHRPTDVNALLDESLNLAYHGARAEKSEFNITLQKDFDDKAGMIEVFPQEITRAFLNFISNGFYAAVKRKAEKGNSGFEPALRVTTRDMGQSVEIRIRDNGTGIPAEVKEKMFNPFFTTKPAGEGTGLGLSMSHDIIVKQHGGAIDVATEPGQFTEFIITLPRAIITKKAAGGAN